ncbi:MAG: N-acetylmuramic acid 6-phosphate etherase, partial [Planctomycetes bacterium]|nr:N-acetylmuramic acid 6-phosphate etherase [Planctomycetota bacterium]
LIAGGPEAMFRSIEGAEDRSEDGEAMLKERGLRPGDVVLGIASSGTTPFVRGALAYAHQLGSRTIFLTCNPNIAPPVPVDVTIRLLVGPEVITGSTRMKAGTATKLVLNTISTAAMIQLGKVYENLMVDMKAWNEKLRDRARRIVMTLTGLDPGSAQRLLDSAQGHVKAALVMHHLRISYDEATERLRRADGFVRRALEA